MKEHAGVFLVSFGFSKRDGQLPQRLLIEPAAADEVDDNDEGRERRDGGGRPAGCRKLSAGAKEGKKERRRTWAEPKDWRLEREAARGGPSWVLEQAGKERGGAFISQPHQPSTGAE